MRNDSSVLLLQDISTFDVFGESQHVLGRLGNCVIILEMLKFRKLNDKSISLIQFSGGFVQVFELNTILSNCCSIHYTSTKSKIIFICILMEFELKQNFVTSLFI